MSPCNQSKGLPEARGMRQRRSPEPWQRSWAKTRAQAISVWRGPRILTADTADGDLFYGWDVLALRVQLASKSEFESRIVYANLGDRQQPQLPVAMLRGVRFNTDMMRANLRDGGETDHLLIPARFVWITLKQAKDWITMFEELRVSVGEHNIHKTAADTRELRIDTNWTSQVFEKRWELRAGIMEELNANWKLTWNDMDVVLRTSMDIQDMTMIRETWVEVGVPKGYTYEVY